MQPTYVSTKEIVCAYGISGSSLRNWAGNKAKGLRVVLTPGGHRRYCLEDVERILGTFHARPSSTWTGSGGRPRPVSERYGIVYARVSSQKQRKAGDLQRQIDALVERHPDYKVIYDVGSGINFKRTGFISLLEHVQRRAVHTIAISARDRLCRFAFDLVEWICTSNGTQIVVLDQNDEQPGSESELAADLMAITTVFVCRHHGRRRNFLKGSDRKGGQGSEQGSYTQGGTDTVWREQDHQGRQSDHDIIRTGRENSTEGTEGPGEQDRTLERFAVGHADKTLQADGNT